LFVDDEPMLVDVGQKILESLGYSVVTAFSSMEGLEIFKKESAKIDLIITDQTMPDMSGYQMAKEAIKVRPDIPIVLCTGYSEVVSEDNAKDVGIREFIMKPIKREKIATIVKRILA
jgi:two-component system, cell cycle sensor histidine kinase and response regulator CckA